MQGAGVVSRVGASRRTELMDRREQGQDESRVETSQEGQTARRFGGAAGITGIHLLIRHSGKEWNFENPSTASFGACGSSME